MQSARVEPGARRGEEAVHERLARPAADTVPSWATLTCVEVDECGLMRLAGIEDGLILAPLIRFVAATLVPPSATKSASEATALA